MPIEAKGFVAQFVLGPYVGGSFLFLVITGIDSELRSGIDRCVVARVDLSLHAIASIDRTESILTVVDPTNVFLMIRRSPPAAIVLQPTIYIVGLSLIDGDRIVLSDGGGVCFEPMISVVVADVATPVVAIDQVAIAFGIDPKCMVVCMYIAFIHIPEGFSSIGRILGGESEYEDLIGIVGRGIDLGKIITVGVENANRFVVRFFPMQSAVFAAVDLAAGDAGILESVVAIQPIPHGGRRQFTVGDFFHNGLGILIAGKSIFLQEAIQSRYVQLGKLVFREIF